MDRPEQDEPQQRSHRLAAIMFTDIQGYTALMQQDEAKAIIYRQRHREVFNVLTGQFNGKILQYYGDGTLSIFDSAINAVNCGIAIQLALQKEPRIPLRVGIHSGDVFFNNEEVIGDGVNVASRVESVALPGSVFISEKVYDEVKNQTDIQTISLGEVAFKNVERPIELFAITNPGLIVPSREQIKALGQLVPAKSAASKRGKNRLFRFRWVYLIVAITVLGYLAYKPGLLTETPIVGNNDSIIVEKAVAVLPFKNIGSDPEGAYFAEGVREEILNHLSRIEGLNVKSRTVVDKYSERTATTQELVKELGLTHYLEGSARKDGNRIRITVQFIDARDDAHVWAENYDREYDNIWFTQSEIATKVAEIMEVKVAPEVAQMIEKRPTDNPAAWDDYLKAMYYLRRYVELQNAEDERYTNAGLKMVEYAKSSIAKDSCFALGYSFLGMLYRHVIPDSSFYFNNIAIELDPDLSTPYYVRAEYNAYIEHDTAAAVRDFRTSIEHGPHLPFPYYHYGWFRRHQGQIPEALVLTFRGMERRPDDWLLGEMLIAVGMDYVDIGDYKKAEYYINKALVLEPENVTFVLRKAHLYRVSGEHDKLLETARYMQDISPDERGPFEMGMYYLLTSRYDSSVAYFDQYFTDETKIGVYSDAHMYAYALQRAGRVDEAAKWNEVLEKSLETRDHPSEDYEYAKIYSLKNMKDSTYARLAAAVDGPMMRFGLPDFMDRDPLFNEIHDESEFRQLSSIAKSKVRPLRERVSQLEKSGQIPADIEWLEL